MATMPRPRAEQSDQTGGRDTRPARAEPGRDGMLSTNGDIDLKRAGAYGKSDINRYQLIGAPGAGRYAAGYSPESPMLQEQTSSAHPLRLGHDRGRAASLPVSQGNWWATMVVGYHATTPRR
jgi:hypothetical protein